MRSTADRRSDRDRCGAGVLIAGHCLTRVGGLFSEASSDPNTRSTSPSRTNLFAPTPIRAWAHTLTGAMTAWCQARAIATDDAPVDVVLLLVDLGFGWKRKSNNSAPCAVRTASLFRSPAMAYAVLPSVYSRKRGPPRRPASILGRSNRGPGAGGSDFSLAARFFHGRCVWPAACFIVLSPRTLRGRRRRAPGAPSWASGRSPGTSLTARPESRPRGVAAHQRPRTACPVRPTGSMSAR
jgi:hypothetical protein